MVQASHAPTLPEVWTDATLADALRINSPNGTRSTSRARPLHATAQLRCAIRRIGPRQPQKRTTRDSRSSRVSRPSSSCLWLPLLMAWFHTSDCMARIITNFSSDGYCRTQNLCEMLSVREMLQTPMLPVPNWKLVLAMATFPRWQHLPPPVIEAACHGALISQLTVSCVYPAIICALRVSCGQKRIRSGRNLVLPRVISYGSNGQSRQIGSCAAASAAASKELRRFTVREEYGIIFHNETYCFVPNNCKQTVPHRGNA